MEWSQEEWLNLLEKAAYLDERRLPAYVSAPMDTETNEPANGRILRWKKIVANGNDVLFQRRLAWEGLSIDEARNRLGVLRFAGPVWPAWTDCLREVLRILPAMAARPLDGDLPFAPFLSAQEVAFEHLMVPFVEYASRSVLAHPAARLLLESAAVADLQRFLLVELCGCAASCLTVEFSAFRAVRGSDVKIAREEKGGSEETPISRALYHAFVDRMWKGKYAEFLQAYPVLARMLAEYSEMWSQFVIEFLERLRDDLPDLERTLGFQGKVTRMNAGLSDRHNNGRVVISLETGSGRAIVYKPKDIHGEQAYYRLLEWLNQRHSPLWPPAFKGLCRNGYGWVATMKASACNSLDEVRKFYYRAGSLLALFHAVGGNDFHGENLLACGDYPALIDAETLLAPELLIAASDTASGSTTREFWDWSVFRTAMLPRWTADRAQQVDTASGLVETGSAPAFTARVCEFPNTDRMAIVEKKLDGRVLSNVPRLNDEPVPAGRHIEDIVSGFRDMYNFLMTSREAIMAAEGPLRYFADLPLRFVFRNSYIYASLIGKLRRPECLRDGVEASLQAEALYKFLLHSETRNHMWPIVGAEVRAVLHGDIPLFNYRSSSNCLELEHGLEKVEAFVQPAFDAMRARFQRLNPADRQLQICYIRSAFKSDAGVLLEDNDEHGPAGPEPESASKCLEAALAIAEEMRSAARTGTGDTVTWISRAFDPVGQVWKLRPMDARLYDGLTGTAVFLAALEKVTGTTGFRGLLMGALRTIESVAPTLQRQSSSDQFSIGAGIGLTSICYGLAKVAELLQMDTALALARTYLGYLTRDGIRADRNFDLMSGAGGSILVLLAMHRLTGEPALLELAVECGEHLLENRSIGGSGFRSWKTNQGRMQTGYSHGAAGIVHALAALYRATSLEPFREAAMEARSFENSLFSKQRGNWANAESRNDKEAPEFWNTWCHGAVGIGLGRLASLDVLGADARRDIDEALKFALLDKFAPIDHVCCGNMGTLELFLCASARLGGRVYLEKATQIGSSVRRRAGANGSYGLGTDKSFASPSFHQGTAGIGYQFLRLAAPQTLPSILLWQ